MGKTRSVYGRFTRGLKPHEVSRGVGFSPDLWRNVNVKGKPILIEHDWRNPGAVGSFVRNWVEYDKKTDEHWCCIEGEIDMDGPHGERVVSDIKAGKYPAWSVSLIQSDPQKVHDVGANREFLEGSLTNDPFESGTQVLVRHNGKGDSVPVTAIPMSVSLEPATEQPAQAEPAQPKTEAEKVTPVATTADPVQPVETQQKASDTLTKQEGQPLAPGAATLSLPTPPVPPMADSTAKTASADQTAPAAGAPAETTPKTTASTSTAKVNLAPPKKTAEADSKKKDAPAAKKAVVEDEIMKENEDEDEKKEDDNAEEVDEKVEEKKQPAQEKKKETAPPKKTVPPAETKKAPAAASAAAAAKPDAEMKDATEAPSANPVKDALTKFASQDPKNAELVMSLMTQLNELKSESAKMREEREAEKAAQAAEKSRLEQIRLKAATEKYSFWSDNIDKIVSDIPSEEKDMVRQVFESDHSEVGNKALESLIDRLTESLANSREEIAQLKKSRTETTSSPTGLSEAQLKSALEQLSSEFGGGGGSSSAPKDESTKRKQAGKNVSVKEPRDLTPTEIMVRHNKVLAGLDSKSATARALSAFGDRAEVDINAHHRDLSKKIEEVRLKKASAQH